MTVTSEARQTGQAALEARLSDPRTVEALGVLLDHADLLAVLVEGLSGLVARSEVIGDSVLDGVKELRETAAGVQGELDLAGLASAGVSLAGVLPQAAPRLVSAVTSGALDKLLATAEVSAGALDQVELLARGMVAGSEDFATRPVEVSGPVSLVKVMRDPDIKRAISFFATVAKAVGRELDKPTSA